MQENLSDLLGVAAAVRDCSACQLKTDLAPNEATEITSCEDFVLLWSAPSTSFHFSDLRKWTKSDLGGTVSSLQGWRGGVQVQQYPLGGARSAPTPLRHMRIASPTPLLHTRALLTQPEA